MSNRRGGSASKRRLPRSGYSAPVEPSFESGILSEPKLLFGGHHRHIDQKTGLALYGPYSVGRDDQIPLRSITVGIVGPADLVFRMRNWLKECQSLVTNDGKNPFWRPAFPGMNETSTFRCDLVFGETWQEILSHNDLQRSLSIPRYWDQLAAIQQLYSGAVERMMQREPKPSVIVCITPEEIDSSLEALEPGLSAEQDDNADESTDTASDDETSSSPINVRRALKAALMRFERPTQLVRGRTLGQSIGGKKVRPRQDPATSAWNLATGLYYKAGSHPWRLADIELGTCYVGISFYRERLAKNPGMRTSLAQVFTHTGDGLVLRGRSFPWSRSQGRSPHLPESHARELMQDVVDLYTKHTGGQPPMRLVVHKSSRFDEAERRGFQQVIEGRVPVRDFVAMEKRGIQLFRQGTHPPLRNTWVRLADGDFLLYTRGYVPFLRIYPGMRVPRPLELIEHIGDSPSDQMMQEILGLTKMNWNSADFACEEPITLAYSRKVGEILALIPRSEPVREEYRYYM